MNNNEKQALIERAQKLIDVMGVYIENYPDDTGAPLTKQLYRVALAALTENWQERAEKSEAQLAELAAKKPVGKFAFEPLAERYHHIKHGESQHTEPKLPLVKLFTRAAPPAPVKLPKRMRIEGGSYCTAHAYYDEEGDYYDRNDVIAALKAAGVEVADE